MPRFWLIVGLLIALLACVQVTSMLGETQTWDEGVHLFAGYSYWMTGEYGVNPEHPPLGKLLNTLPLIPLHPKFERAWLDLTPVIAGVNFVWINHISPELIMGLSRSVTVLLTLVLAAFVAWWTRRHFGDLPALIATALVCFDPNIIAHGRYVTTDLIAALFIFMACALFIDAMLLPERWRVPLAGLALGLALTSKYSAAMLVPVLLIIALIRKRPGAILIMLLTAAAVVMVVYAPEFIHYRSLDRLGPHLTKLGTLGPILDWCARVLHLPALTFLIGLDRLSEHDLVGHPSYLLGQISNSGWWYYFPIVMLVKTPVSVLLALVATAVLIWRTPGNKFAIATLAAVAMTFFALCLRSRIDIGIRHVLPVYPLLYVLIGIVFARWRRWALALVLLVAVESLSVYPHYLAYFNFASGGPGNGPKYLLDSNIDWGQDVKKLGRYMAEHKIPYVCLCFFGKVDLLRYGVEYINMTAKPADNDCIAAISVTPLYGLYVRPDEFAWLRSQKPLAKIGYSIYLYDLRKKH